MQTYPQAVIVFGIAGQLDPNVPVGTIVVPRLWRSELSEGVLRCSDALFHMASHVSVPIASGKPILCGGSGVTLRQPAWSKSERRSVLGRYRDATICDMETFTVLEQFPESASLAIRIVSDDGAAALTSALEENGEPAGAPGRAHEKRAVALLLPSFKEHCATLARFVFAFLQELVRVER